MHFYYNNFNNNCFGGINFKNRQWYKEKFKEVAQMVVACTVAAFFFLMLCAVA